MTFTDMITKVRAHKRCIYNKIDAYRHCPHDCDNCDILYDKGTLGEQLEMYNWILSILERIKHEKEEWFDDNIASPDNPEETSGM